MPERNMYKEMVLQFLREANNIDVEDAIVLNHSSDENIYKVFKDTLSNYRLLAEFKKEVTGKLWWADKNIVDHSSKD